MTQYYKNIFSLLIIFFFVIASSILSGSASDSLLSEIKKNPKDTVLFENLSDEIYRNMYNNTDFALGQSQELLKIAIAESYTRIIARMLMQIGIIYDLKGMYDSAFIKYNEGLAVTEQYNHIKIKGDIYNNFSITLAVVGELNESVRYALLALDIYEDSGDSTRIAKIYNNLGARYSDMEQREDALKYYKKAATINESRNDNYRLAHNYGNIGLIYYDLSENEKALEYFQKSIEFQDTVNNIMDYSIGLHNLALAYNRLGNYQEALKYERMALNLSHEINDELGKLTSLNGLAAIYDELGSPEKALQFLDRSENIANDLGARYYLIKIYEKKANVYSRTGNFEQAFIYNRKYSDLKDSILTVEKDKALNKLDKYEIEKQEKEIQLLTLDSEVQKLNIKRQKILRNSISIVGVLILILSAGLYHRYRYVRKTRNELEVKNEVINKEKDRSDELLLNILPAETAQELKASGSSQARHFDMVTVMFTDFKGFTSMAEKLTPQELVDEIDFCFKNFDQIISEFNIEKIKTIGDAYMCAGGLPVANSTNPVDIVNAAQRIQRFMEELKQKRKAENKLFFELRIGIHTGPVVAGIVGIKKFQYDIWGDTVNIASRMESSGEIGHVNISSSTFEKVKDNFKCTYRGKIEAKGKGEVDMYFVEGERSD